MVSPANTEFTPVNTGGRVHQIPKALGFLPGVILQIVYTCATQQSPSDSAGYLNSFSPRTCGGGLRLIEKDKCRGLIPHHFLYSVFIWCGGLARRLSRQGGGFTAGSFTPAQADGRVIHTHICHSERSEESLPSS